MIQQKIYFGYITLRAELVLFKMLFKNVSSGKEVCECFLLFLITCFNLKAITLRGLEAHL